MSIFHLKRRLATTVSRTFGEIPALLKPITGRRVLMYHAVGEPVVGDSNAIYSISKDRLSEHFSFLDEYRRERLELSPIYDGCTVSISFDDGYKSFRDVVVPLAEQWEIPVHVFVSREFILEGHQTFMNSADIKSLSTHRLVSFGVHGNHHRDLTLLDDEGIRLDLDMARDWLQQLLGREITTLSYPFGAVNSRVARIAAELGFSFGFTSQYGIQSPRTNPHLIPRIDVWSSDSVRTLASKLRGSWSLVTRFQR